MNSFIENVNYVANLDNKYGSSIEIYKNNLSLRTELHDIVFTLGYYNFTDKKLHTLEYSYNDISIDNFNSTLLNLKSQVELTGLFDCVVSFSYTNFIINNVASIHIKITSKSENIKTYGLNLNITKDLTEIYNINGIVSDTLKILPYLSSIDSDAFDSIINVSNNIEAIQNTEENANIAIAQANIAISKASEALLSANSASASEAVSIEKSNIAIAKASEAFTSASEALASENAAKSSETNSSINEVNASTSANNASISEANALASANSASVSSAIAINKSTEASASASNALDSENSALDSKNSAIASATTAITKASEAFSSAVSASASATVATTKAGEASTSATNAAASETSASTSATTATTKASEALVSATSAAASATDASTSATQSATSAGQSATSASSAASSATDANTSKLAAANSAGDASASAASANQSALDAIEALDEFTDIYLGRKAAAPSVDNDGSMLVEGTIYWNTTLKSLFIYDGTMWDPAVFNASGAVVSFNDRSGAVTLTNADVTGATGQDLSVVGTPSFDSVKVTGSTGSAGTMSWNSDESTVDLVLENGVTLQVGQENNRLVRNDTGVTITNMTVCMFAGTIGNSGRVKVAPFDGLFNHAHYIYGIATQNIIDGSDGYITIDGKVREVNTTGSLVGETWNDGDILYAKPNDNGRLTNVEPADDELKIVIASVVNAHTNGTLEVRVLPFNENMIAKRANKLTTARTISLSGDASGSVDFDGSANVSMTVAVSDDSHLHSFSNITDKPTTISEYGIIDATPSSHIGSTGSAHGNATTTAAGFMSIDDKAKLDLVSGTNTGDETLTTIKTKLGITTLSGSNTGDQTIKLTGDITGSGTGSFDTTLKNSGVSAGTYKSVTVNEKGIVTGGTNPTTISGFGITDAYTKAEVNTIVDNLDALPDQTGFAGKYLKTDGTTATWESASTGTGITNTEFVATAGQTEFTVAYTAGNLDVYQNGLLLSDTDYVATNGTSIVLVVGATTGDLVSVKVYDTFNVANTYTKAEVDTAVGTKQDALINKSTIVSPVDGTADFIGAVVSDTYTTSDNYKGVQDYIEWVFATDAGFTNIVDSYSGGLNLSSYTPAIGLPLTQVFARVRKGSDNHLSAWSDTISFTTPSVYVLAPTVTVTGAPANIGRTPTITTSAFSVFNGSDTHLSTDWRVYQGGALVWESLSNTTNKLSIEVPSGLLAVSTEYTFEARHNGTIYGSFTYGSITGTTKANFSVAYGVQWNPTTDLYTRTGVAEGVAVSTSYAGNIQSLMRRCVLNANGTVNYYLNATNSAFREDGVTAADLTGASGNVMVQIPKFYYKYENVGGVHSWSVSLEPEVGYIVHPAFIKAGVEVPYRYYCAYEGYTNGSKLISRSGVTPTVSKTIATFRTEAIVNGTGWGLIDWNTLYAVQLLFLTEYADFDTQAMIGNGNDSGNDYTITTGQSNSIGNTSSPNTNDDMWMSYRGIENWYASMYKFIDGVNIQNRVYYVNNNPATYASDVFTGDYVAIGVTSVSTSGYVSNIIASNRGFVASAVAGSSSTFIPDYFYQNAGNTIMMFGGRSGNGFYCGGFFLSASAASSDSGAYLGSGVCF